MSAIDALFEKIREISRGGPRSLKKEIFDLKDWLGAFKARRPQGYMSRPLVRSAYLSYHLPLHLPELYWILSQRDFVKDNFKSKDSLLIGDLGAGPGTASLSFMSWALVNGLKDKKISFELFDSSAPAMDTAKKLLGILKKDLSVQTQRRDLRQELKHLSENKYNLLIVSHLFNEWGNGPRYLDRKLNFIAQAESYLADDGFLLIIEPPLREPTLDLMSIRDTVTNDTELELQVVQPCPGNLLLCPMKANSLGWCYAQPPRQWAKERGLTPWDREIERTLDKRLDKPGFSYLLFQKRSPAASPLVLDHSISIADDRHRDGMRCTPKGVKKGQAPHRGAYLTPSAKV